MKNIVSNPCTRCGKERILLRKWTEEIPGYSSKVVKITRSLNVCPDPECQKIVEEELASQKQKRDKMKADREAKSEIAAEKRLADKKKIA